MGVNRWVGFVSGLTAVVVLSSGLAGCANPGSDGLFGTLSDAFSDEKARCDTYEGPNPTAAELQAARRDSTEALWEMMEKAGVPTGSADGRQAFIDANSTIFQDEVELALAQAPQGSVAAYTEYLCDPPVEPDSPEAKQLLGDTSAQLEQLRSNPALADVDWDAAVAEMKDINRKYAVIQAVMPLTLCGTAIKASQPVDTSSLEQVKLSADLQNWMVEGFRLLCPGQVPAAATATGVQDCGPLPDLNGHVLTEGTTISCADATDLMTRYLEDPRTRAGDRGAQMGEWDCGILGAARADELGYYVVCISDGGKVTLGG